MRRRRFLCALAVVVTAGVWWPFVRDGDDVVWLLMVVAGSVLLVWLVGPEGGDDGG